MPKPFHPLRPSGQSRHPSLTHVCSHQSFPFCPPPNLLSLRPTADDASYFQFLYLTSDVFSCLSGMNEGHGQYHTWFVVVCPDPCVALDLMVHIGCVLLPHLCLKQGGNPLPRPMPHTPCAIGMMVAQVPSATYCSDPAIYREAESEPSPPPVRFVWLCFHGECHFPPFPWAWRTMMTIYLADY